MQLYIVPVVEAMELSLRYSDRFMPVAYELACPRALLRPVIWSGVQRLTRRGIRITEK